MDSRYRVMQSATFPSAIIAPFSKTIALLHKRVSRERSCEAKTRILDLRMRFSIRVLAFSMKERSPALIISSNIRISDSTEVEIAKANRMNIPVE